MCKYISEHNIDGFLLDNYMKRSLGIKRGINEVLTERSIEIPFWYGPVVKVPISARRCLIDGGGDEDSPFIRCKNHFHDPLELWSEAGLNDGEGLLRCESSIIWAQRNEGKQYFGNYSWFDARKYFYIALTSHESRIRNENIVNTFLSVGHLMHLVQDSSVPEHVRDNSHILAGNDYENYTSEYNDMYKPNKYLVFARWLSNESFYTDIDAAYSLQPNTYAPIPIARVVDTDRYDGKNPDITMTTPIGLAEYTNANYFSTDTVFATDNYPFPSWNSVNHTVVRFQDPRNEADDVHREYLVKMHHGDTEYRLCTAPVLYGQVPETGEYLAPILDQNVYGDYAERLIPRAVSYSAGLLKYFFRGTLELTLPPDGVYCFRPDEPADPRTQGFDRVSLYVRNTTSTGEQMTGGSIELVVKYRFLTDDPDAQDPRPTAMDPFTQYTPENLPVSTGT